jgi:HEPN/Toprim N-terminal domain 1
VITASSTTLDNTSLAAAMRDQDEAPAVNYDEFARILASVNVTAVRLPEHKYDYDLGEFAAKAILADPEFVKAHHSLRGLNRHEGTFFENLDPYLVLRLLAENKDNLDLDVVWRFADVVDGGWVQADDVRSGVSEADTILVVTEGSTDGTVLKKSLPVVLPDVADFFSFIDMTDNYPFTGTGNVVRFCQGLARIKIQNRILVVLDNDSAGHDALARIRQLALPRRMRATVLPDLEECRNVHTLGPSGDQHADINGKAVSIEWFLDTQLPGRGAPVVRWTGFNGALGTYQGELVDKQAYTRHFFDHMDRPNQTWPKLEQLWRHLLRTCTVPCAL